ncbi:reverse transcriptase domain-containing protein [Burkholderia sp. SCN-KJ]|uniref:reverse transcriptase domain-containing protein n=1 Tax=Burkholderia sp. SCN-KJ TaxID=2969248 RepID=UPI0035B4814C
MTQGEVGTVQGGSNSPLLSNIYLHYAFDLWLKQWRARHAEGDVIVVRHADDWIAGFQNVRNAMRFQREVTARLARFGLTPTRARRG